MVLLICTTRGDPELQIGARALHTLKYGVPHRVAPVLLLSYVQFLNQYIRHVVYITLPKFTSCKQCQEIQLVLSNPG